MLWKIQQKWKSRFPHNDNILSLSLLSVLASFVLFCFSNICSLTNSRRFQVVSTKQSQTFYLDYYTVHKNLIRRLHDAYRQFQWLCWQKAERWRFFFSSTQTHTDIQWTRTTRAHASILNIPICWTLIVDDFDFVYFSHPRHGAELWLNIETRS